MELAVAGRSILIDCGMFQGSRTLEELNRRDFDFDPAKIEAVILTHAHIDHCGLLPKLVKQGFAGAIWCTGPTRELLHYMLPDAAHIAEADAEHRNKREDRAGEDPIEPIYTEADAYAACGRTHAVALETWFEPAPGFRARLWNAGHILGSASAEVEAGGVHMLFSGDLGPDHKAFYPDPQSPATLDHVVCESTYGDRTRPHTTIEERRSLLQREVVAALERGGNLVIPVFALERTQELLLDLATLIDTGRIPNTLVCIDSPLASQATEVFARHAAELEDTQPETFRHPAFHYTQSVAESIALNRMKGVIILSASGMCEAGRIRHHLLHNLGRSEATVLFVGYQAAGTLGRAILEGARRVRISGSEVPVRAAIRRIDSYSAHADKSELLKWIAARRPIAGSLFLDHGEPEGLAALAREAAEGDRRASILLPEMGDRFALPAGAPASRLATGDGDLREAKGSDWQNDYADFAAGLKTGLRAIHDPGKRREAVRKMRELLETYNAD
jgi:metallo-beta-lactamase family protein